MHASVTPVIVPPMRWVMWAIPVFLFLIGFFHRAAPGVIARDLMQAFEATGATIGLLAATDFYSYAGLMVPAGLLLDAFGARRVRSAARPDRAGGRVTPAGLDFNPELTQLAVLFHAGAIIALAGETATAAAMGETNPSGECRPELFPLTLHMSANVIRNTNQGTRGAEAEIVHRGRTTMPADRPGR